MTHHVIQADGPDIARPDSISVSNRRGRVREIEINEILGGIIWQHALQLFSEEHHPLPLPLQQQQWLAASSSSSS